MIKITLKIMIRFKKEIYNNCKIFINDVKKINRFGDILEITDIKNNIYKYDFNFIANINCKETGKQNINKKINKEK